MPSPLSHRDIQQFARSAATDNNRVETVYQAAQDEVKASGFKVTARVRDILWAELVRLGAVSGCTA
jgi:hypothetical protein